MRSFFALSPLFVTLLALSPVPAAPITYDVLVDTEEQFSGTYSVRVGYVDPLTKLDDGTQELTITGTMPGAKLQLGQTLLFDGIRVSLENSASVAAGQPVSYYGRWLGEFIIDDLEVSLWDYALELKPTYVFGGLNDGWDDPANSGMSIDNFIWGFHEGTFSIKKVATNPPTGRVPDSGAVLPFLAVILTGMAVVRRFGRDRSSCLA